MIYLDFYNTEEIEKEWKRLKIEDKYHFFDLDDIFTHDISFYLSIRKDAGKTTNTLILACILHKKYGVITEYIRNDNDQTVFGVVGKLFDTIKAHNYIQRIFGCYNDVEYNTREKAFRLVYRNSDGEIERAEEDTFLRIKSNENYARYKSGYNSPRSWLLIWDEFLDSQQSHSYLVQKMFDNISTFTRDNPRAHVIALSNTVNKYDAVFEDLNLIKEVEFMSFGEHKSIVTDLGSRYYVELLPVSQERKKSLKDKKIRFYGISKSKFANFTGVDAWKGYNYKHLMDDTGEVKAYTMIAFIYHRERWLSVSVVEFEDPGQRPAVHIAKSNKPKYIDRIVYTLEPNKVNEKLIRNCNQFLKTAIQEDRLYFSSNEVGLLFDDFLKENGIKPAHR